MTADEAVFVISSTITVVSGIVAIIAIRRHNRRRQIATRTRDAAWAEIGRRLKPREVPAMTHTHWIPVKNKLPPPARRHRFNRSTDVLTFFGKSTTPSIRICYVRYSMQPEPPEWIDSIETASLMGITHWMPLPSFPETKP